MALFQPKKQIFDWNKDDTYATSALWGAFLSKYQRSFFPILFSFQMCLSPSFPLHTGEAHKVCREGARWKPQQLSWLQNNNNNKNKTNPGMDVANQPLKLEVVLDWATIGKRLPATGHVK